MVGLFQKVLAASQALFFFSPTDSKFEMAISKLPTVSLKLTPVFGAPPLKHNESFISILLTIESPEIKVNDTLVKLPLLIANVPSQRYGEGDLQVSDAAGAVPVSIVDSGPDGVRSWLAGRDTEGDVTVSCRAFPRYVDMKTPPGPRMDMRIDSGGLITTGHTMLPLPPDDGLPKKIYNTSLEWDLDQVPKGSRAVWSFGEGPKLISRQGSLDVLRNTVYTVGPIQSYPPTPSDDDYFGFYWFGNPPFNATELGKTNEDLFAKMSEFFQDPPSTLNPYRIFSRKSSPARGFGGGGYERSYLLEYDDNYESFGYKSVYFLLSHEMVHNWPLMSRKEDPDAECEWYSEGAAEYYGRILPFRYNHVDKNLFLEAINDLASAYYTNPHVRMTEEEARRTAWESSHSQRIPYNRGFMFLVKMNTFLKQATNGAKSLDDIALALLQINKEKLRVTEQDWLDLMTPLLGSSTTISELESMYDGNLIIPPPDCMAEYGLQLVRHDQEMLDLGFDLSTLNARIIKGLNSSSRAYEAGIREGDLVLRNSYLFQPGDDIKRNMELTLERDGKVFNVSYWPRTYEKVEGYQWILVDSANEEL